MPQSDSNLFVVSSLPPPNIPSLHPPNNISSSISLPSINNPHSNFHFSNNSNHQIEGQGQGDSSHGRRRPNYEFDCGPHGYHKDRVRTKHKAGRKFNSPASSSSSSPATSNTSVSTPSTNLPIPPQRTEHDVFNQLYQYASHSLINSRILGTYNGTPEWNYTLEIGQHPQRARMCGFGEKDRRPISPLPFVKLIITTNNNDLVNIEDVDTGFYICQAILYEYGTNREATLVVHPASQSSLRTSSSLVNATANLVGTPIAQARVLRDVNNDPGIWFVYRDLSVRTDGKFYLEFQLFYIGFRGNVNTTRNPSTILAKANSKPFTVYTAKKFPGMVEITPLTKAFLEQGSKIPSRRDLKKNKQ